MSKIKAGIDAIVVQSLVQKNVGKRVRVIKLVGDLKMFDSYDVGDGIEREVFVDGIHWLVAPLDEYLIGYYGNELTEAVYPESWLQPIDGLLQNNNIKTKTHLEAVL